MGTESAVVVGTVAEVVVGTLKRWQKTAFENGENYSGTLMLMLGLCQIHFGTSFCRGNSGQSGLLICK